MTSSAFHQTYSTIGKLRTSTAPILSRFAAALLPLIGGIARADDARSSAEFNITPSPFSEVNQPDWLRRISTEVARPAQWTIISAEQNWKILGGASSTARPLPITSAVVKRVENQPSLGKGPLARPQGGNPASRYVSYARVARDAKRQGGYRPGQRVVIAVAQDADTCAVWSRVCALHGWTFCVHNRPLSGLGIGVHDCLADQRGQLRFLDAAAPAASETARQIPQRLHETELPLFQRPIYYFAPEYQTLLFPMDCGDGGEVCVFLNDAFPSVFDSGQCAGRGSLRQ